MKDPGDHRLSRLHDHGPGGLNGRVWNENGLTPPVRLWRLTMKPISRLSLLVGERSNPDQIFKLEIEDAERKTVEQALPIRCVLVGCPTIRMLLDQIDNALDFCLKGKTKPCLS